MGGALFSLGMEPLNLTITATSLTNEKTSTSKEPCEYRHKKEEKNNGILAKTATLVGNKAAKMRRYSGFQLTYA
jgi:hypothetical protein